MKKLDLTNLPELAHAIGEEARKRTYNSVCREALILLRRSKPIIEILQQHDIPPFIGPMEQSGFHIVIKEAEPEFFKHIEEIAGKPLDEGTILYPCLFGTYAARSAAANEYREVLRRHQIKSEIILLQNPGTEEDMVVVYIPPIPE